MRRIMFMLFAALLYVGAATPVDITARWVGFWIVPEESWAYNADATLDVDPENRVVGTIRWTLVKSPRPAEQAKLGLTGVEHVRGVFFPEAGVVRIEGWSLDDTHGILGKDKYRLILSDDGKILGGITSHHGRWNAQILLRRQ